MSILAWFLVICLGLFIVASAVSYLGRRSREEKALDAIQKEGTADEDKP